MEQREDKGAITCLCEAMRGRERDTDRGKQQERLDFRLMFCVVFK